MPKNQAIDEKVREVSVIIRNLEKEIAEQQRNVQDADSMRDKIFNLQRKLGLFRELLKSYSSSPFNFRNMC